MFGKGTWDAVKAFFDAMKVPLVILVVVYLYNYPGTIKEFIKGTGFRLKEWSAFGLTLEEVAANLDDTGQKLDQVTAALAERDMLLREIAQETSDERIKSRVQAELVKGDAITTSALAAASQATSTAAEITESLQSPAQSTPAVSARPALTQDYLVVFGADLDVAAALPEIDRVKRRLPQDAANYALFKKGSFYRSAALFDSAALRDANVAAIAAAAGRSVEPVALARWCPGASPIPESDAPVPVFQC